MAAREILLLGNPLLRQRCRNVRAPRSEDTRQIIIDLRDTLEEFRSRRGFGRGIAAPQIGAAQKIIYVNSDYTGALINPVILRRSRMRFRLWDDCFSFPDLLARVRRHHSVEVSYEDLEGGRHTFKATGALSELLQHEIDHLDGILAIDRAIDRKHIILRSELDRFTTEKGVTM